MSRVVVLVSLPALWLSVAVALAGAQTRPEHPVVRQAVDAISEERIAAILRKLESFGTRHTMSSQDHPTRGIGAARRWIEREFRGYSPRLEVRDEVHRVKAQSRIPRDVEIHNIVAVLPGRTPRQILVTAHYDSLNLGGDRSEQTSDTGELTRQEELPAPGVSDDASGMAAVMEMARVLSAHEFEKTLVFVAFAGEEQMMIGSTLYAAAAKQRGDEIEAVLNSDIIGTERRGDGRTETHALRVYSAGPADSKSRAVARYVRSAALQYLPGMRVDLVFRQDRFLRGGDHAPFDAEGYGAVRLTTPNENYGHQHNLLDNFANASVPYTARVTRVKAAAAASLALAPAPPYLNEQRAIGRGSSRYDAVVNWSPEGDPERIAGYVVVARSTLAPFWQREYAVPADAREWKLAGVSIDDTILGVKAVGKNGVESLVSTAEPPERQKQTIETY